MFQMMAQGGNISSYRPSLVQHKISPTGRKISLDRGLNTLGKGGRLSSMPPSSSISSRRVSHPHYENISNLMPVVTITVTQDDFLEEDSQSDKIDDQTIL